MTDKEKSEMLETIMFSAELYYNMFEKFYEKCGNMEQAYRLTRDMHGSLFGQKKNDALSIYWDK